MFCGPWCECVSRLLVEALPHVHRDDNTSVVCGEAPVLGSGLFFRELYGKRNLGDGHDAGLRLEPARLGGGFLVLHQHEPAFLVDADTDDGAAILHTVADHSDGASRCCSSYISPRLLRSRIGHKPSLVIGLRLGAL